MGLHWGPDVAPFDWQRDADLNAELADRRDRRTGGRRKGDGAALAEPDAGAGEGPGASGSASAPLLDPSAELMAVTLDEVYAALKPAKASLK